MKKSLFFAAVAAMLFAGCVKHQHVQVSENEKNLITYQTLTAKGTITKADSHLGVMDDTEYKKGEKFVSAAFQTDNQKPIIGKSVVSYYENENVWRTEDLHYWPEDNQFGLDFYSASPAYLNDMIEITATDGVVLKDFNITENPTVDFMVADMVTGIKANTTNANNSSYNGVPTLFRHKLARVVGFNIILQEDPQKGHTPENLETGDKRVFLNLVQMEGLAVAGTYTSTKEVNANNEGTWEMKKSGAESPDAPGIPTIAKADTSHVTWFKGSMEITNYCKNPEITAESLKEETFQEVTANQNNAAGNKIISFIPVIPIKYNVQAIHVICTIEQYNKTTNEWTVERKKNVITPLVYLVGIDEPSWKYGSKCTYNIVISPFSDPDTPTEPSEPSVITWAPSVEGWISVERTIFM